MERRDQCLSLAQILVAFNAPISEEQCWAVAFQTFQLIHGTTLGHLLLLDPDHLLLARDGSVHPNSLSEGLLRV